MSFPLFPDLATYENQEFETPLKLFDSGGLFRSMCDRSSIYRDDILNARRGEMIDST